MTAQIQDLDPSKDEFASIDQLDAERNAKAGGQTPSNVDADELPEKYRNKSPKELAQMHMEAEKLLGKHSQEVGFARQVAADAAERIRRLERQFEQNPPAPKQDTAEDVDFFTDPLKAVDRAVSQNPHVLAAQKAAKEARDAALAQRLKVAHNDIDEVMQDPEFHQYVQSSQARLRLARMAAEEADFDSADELLSGYKLRKQTTQQRATEVQNQQRQQTQQAKKDAAVDAGAGHSGTTAKPVYRRADLIKLKQTNPDRYYALEAGIYEAYAEGRVRD